MVSVIQRGANPASIALMEMFYGRAVKAVEAHPDAGQRVATSQLQYTNTAGTRITFDQAALAGGALVEHAAQKVQEHGPALAPSKAVDDFRKWQALNTALSPAVTHTGSAVLTAADLAANASRRMDLTKTAKIAGVVSRALDSTRANKTLGT